MNKIDLLLLFDYYYWANRRILAAAQGVSSEQFTVPYPLSHGSLRGTLVHTLSAEIIWRQRCQERISPSSVINEQDFPDLPSLMKRWQAEEQAMHLYLQSLTDDHLGQTIHYQNTKGKPFHNTLWHLLAHLVNHGTQTRSEAALALTAYGSSPGDLDLLLFWRELEEGLTSSSPGA
jgi:uncharacterized damage-inducible protein DinB